MTKKASEKKEPIKHTYRLRENVERHVSASLRLKGDETVELTPEQARQHEDVLIRVDTKPPKAKPSTGGEA